MNFFLSWFGIVSMDNVSYTHPLQWSESAEGTDYLSFGACLVQVYGLA